MAVQRCQRPGPLLHQAKAAIRSRFACHWQAQQIQRVPLQAPAQLVRNARQLLPPRLPPPLCVLVLQHPPAQSVKQAREVIGGM